MIDLVVDQFREFHIQIGDINHSAVEIYKEHILFTWRWWLVLALATVPWILWFRYRPKTGWGPLLLAGSAVHIIAAFLDSMGVAYGLWSYPIIVLPYLHTYYIPWDFTVLPVLTMFMLQYKKNTPSYIKGIIFSIFCSYVAEPLLVWMKIYTPIKWEHYYGLPIYFLIFMIADKVHKIKTF